MKNIVIIGAGDLGKEVVWLIEDINKVKPTYVILGFLDDDKEKTGKEFYGYKVLGTTEDLPVLHDKVAVSAVLAIQDGSVRKRIVETLSNFNSWETILHPSAIIADTSPLGRGSIVFPHVTVSVDTKLGDFCLFYIHSIICNDCRIGNYVSVMAGAMVSERAFVSNECCLALGACVLPNQKYESSGRETK